MTEDDYQPKESMPIHRPILLVQAAQMLCQWIMENSPIYPPLRYADPESVSIIEDAPIPNTGEE